MTGEKMQPAQQISCRHAITKFSRNWLRSLGDKTTRWTDTAQWICCAFFQTGSGAHTASYQMGTEGFFPEAKATGAWSWPLTSFQRRGQECVALYLHSKTSLWCGA